MHVSYHTKTKNNIHFNFRWLKGLNVSIASEAKQRKMAKTIVGDNLVAERGAFTFPHNGGEVVKEAAFVYCPNLIAKVTDIVEHHRQAFIIIQVDTCNL